MRKFGALLKVSFWGMLYAMNLAGGNRKRRISGAGVLALAGGLMLMLSATYSFSFSTMLAQQGMVDMLLLLSGSGILKVPSNMLEKIKQWK